jgi:hypothetical protein
MVEENVIAKAISPRHTISKILFTPAATAGIPNSF